MQLKLCLEVKRAWELDVLCKGRACENSHAVGPEWGKPRAVGSERSKLSCCRASVSKASCCVAPRS